MRSNEFCVVRELKRGMFVVELLLASNMILSVVCHLRPLGYLSSDTFSIEALLFPFVTEPLKSIMFELRY